MLPAQYNLPDAYRGDSYGPIIFSFYDQDKNPLLVEDATICCTVGNQESVLRNKIVVLNWPDTTHGITLSGNQATLETVPADEMKMLPGIYYYDLQVTLNGYTRTFLRGNLTIQDEVACY